MVNAQLQDDVYIQSLLNSFREQINQDEDTLLSGSPIDKESLKTTASELSVLIDYLQGQKQDNANNGGSSQMLGHLTKLGSDAQAKMQKLFKENKNLENELHKSNALFTRLKGQKRRLMHKQKRNVKTQQVAAIQLKGTENEAAEMERLLLSRQRMLELSQEKNIYKQKLVYTYISIAIVILLFIIGTVSFYQKK